MGKEKACPLIASVPGASCMPIMDQSGCCVKGYDCAQPPAPPIIGGPGRLGGGGLLGGYRKEELSGETKKLAAVATKKLLPSTSLSSGCEELVLLEVQEVARQVVAGTNFKLKFRLRTIVLHSMVLCSTLKYSTL